MTLDAWMYGDPAKVAERLEQDRLGCSLCVHHRLTLMRAWCGNERNSKQRGFPVIGARCEWFEEASEAKGERDEASND